MTKKFIDMSIIIVLCTTGLISHEMITGRYWESAYCGDYAEVTLSKTAQENEWVEEAEDTESWTIDPYDGTMYFFLDDSNGWRLVVADAAAGSRFYIMEKTVDGGTTWKRINGNPYNDQLGVAEGLIFFDQNFGFAGIAGASHSYSALYITRDGGMSFEKIELPMDTVMKLPELAEQCGFTVKDYDYLIMPENDDGTLKITVTTEAAETEGIVFQSIDDGVTWNYNGITQKN